MTGMDEKGMVILREEVVCLPREIAASAGFFNHVLGKICGRGILTVSYNQAYWAIENP